MHSFLTIKRLEDLYSNVSSVYVDTLLKETASTKASVKYGFYGKHQSSLSRPSVFQIGHLMERVMGSAYRSQLTRKRYRNYVEHQKRDEITVDDDVISKYVKVKIPILRRLWHRVLVHFKLEPELQEKIVENRDNRTSRENRENLKNAHLSDVEVGNEAESSPEVSEKKEFAPDELPSDKFVFPFTELFIWAILNQRQEMAMFMWENGEDALAKALVALKIYKQLAKELEEEDIDIAEVERLVSSAKQFADLALELLDVSFRNSTNQTSQLLTYEMDNWSRRTNLDLAYAARHYDFFEHAGVQTILQSLWIGGLHASQLLTLRIFLSIIFFPITYLKPDLFVTFKTKEQVDQQAKNFEEHLAEDTDSTRSSICTSITTSEPSTVSSTSSTGSYTNSVKTNKSGAKNNRLRQRKSSISANRSGQKWKNPTNFEPSIEVKNSLTTDLNTSDRANRQVNFQDKHHLRYFEKEELENRSSSFISYDRDELSRGKKRHELFAAPIMKYWLNFLGYVGFILVFIYTVLTPMGNVPNLIEYYRVVLQKYHENGTFCDFLTRNDPFRP